MKRHDIILSAASVASALSAIASIGAQGMAVEPRPSDGTYGSTVAKGLAQGQAQSQLRHYIPALAHSIRIDGELLSERYAQVAQSKWDAQFGAHKARIEGSPPVIPLVQPDLGNPNYVDNTLTSSVLCYSNCHSACHGSRSWR